MPRIGKKKVVSFLVSGSGIIFSSIAEQIIKKKIHARLGAVITDNASAGVLKRARNFGIPSFVAKPSQFSSREEQEREIAQILERYNTDLIVAAGYLRLLSHGFVEQYRNRIINIHPSLLPSFPGMQSQRRALEYGVKVTGCTAHFVDEGMDTGPIIMQGTVAIADTDTIRTLSARILKEECRILSEAVRLFCDGKLEVAGQRVFVRRCYFLSNLCFRPFSRIWKYI